MDKKIVERIPYEGMKNGTHLDVEVYYSKGGTSYLSGTVSPRGYYLSVTPVTCRSGMVSHTLFSGARKLLMQTKRFSSKQLEQAAEMSKVDVPALIEQVLIVERSV